MAWSTTYKGTPDSETFHRVHCIACEVYFPNMHCREPEGASKAIITSTVTGSKKLQIFISFSVHFQSSGDIRIGNNLASVNLDLLRPPKELHWQAVSACRRPHPWEAVAQEVQAALNQQKLHSGCRKKLLLCFPDLTSGFEACQML